MGEGTAMVIFTVMDQITSAMSLVLPKKGTRMEKKILAIKLTQRAINNTTHYLVKSNNDYEPNSELSDLWNDAFAAMLHIDKTLARRINDKSKFWSNPHIWLVKEGSMELIPSLQELQNECDSILAELERRRN